MLLGDLGTGARDSPARVEIVGSVPLQGGGDAVGAEIDRVTPLGTGAPLVLAELFPANAMNLAGAPGGNECPRGRTRRVVQLTFAAGLSAPGGRAIGDAQRSRIRVTEAAANGAVRTASPFALGDLDDGDNVLDLCLDDDATPTKVDVPAGTFTDPHGDPNPATGAPIAPP
jgi:hypothetical protein